MRTATSGRIASLRNGPHGQVFVRSVPWLVFGSTLLVLVLRMPEAVFRAEFWAEDGLFYGDALAGGLASLVEPYAGYFILGIRAVALLETLAPPAYAPAIGNVVSILIMAGVATFATSARMPWDRATGVLIAVGTVLVPIGFELVGTLVHIVWPVTLWMAFVAISREPETPLGRRMETIALVLAGLTGIGVVFALPLFILGPRRRLLAVIGAAIVQIVSALLTFGDRPGSLGADWLLAPYVWLLRAVVTPLLGDTVTAALPPEGIILIGGSVVAIAVTLLLRTPKPIAALVVLLVVAIPLAGIVAGGESTLDLLRPAWAPRYFWSAAVGFVVLVAVNRRRLPAVPLIALFVLGATLEFDIRPAPEMGWAERSVCIGGSQPCEIPVAPGDKWNVRWRP
jgi:hypothetical protein